METRYLVEGVQSLALSFPPLIVSVSCPYCSRAAELVNDVEVLGSPHGGSVWLCRPCKAWVGVHPSSTKMKPMGSLAKEDLRVLRRRAFFHFDQIWKSAMNVNGWSRTKAYDTAYRWLAKQLGIPSSVCNIGFFDEARTLRVIDICSGRSEETRKAA